MEIKKFTVAEFNKLKKDIIDKKIAKLEDAKKQLKKRYAIGHHIIAANLGKDSEPYKAIVFWGERIKSLKQEIEGHKLSSWEHLPKAMKTI